MVYNTGNIQLYTCNSNVAKTKQKLIYTQRIKNDFQKTKQLKTPITGTGSDFQTKVTPLPGLKDVLVSAANRYQLSIQNARAVVKSLAH